MTEEMLKLAREFYGYGPQDATDPELEDDVERLAALLTDEIRKARLEESKVIRKEAQRLKKTETALSRGWYGGACDDLMRFADQRIAALEAEIRSLGGTTK